MSENTVRDVVKTAQRANSALTHVLGLVRALGLVKKDVKQFSGKKKIVRCPEVSEVSEAPKKMSAAEQEQNTQRLLKIFEDTSKIKPKSEE